MSLINLILEKDGIFVENKELFYVNILVVCEVNVNVENV